VDDCWGTSLRHYPGRHQGGTRVRSHASVRLEMEELNGNEKKKELPKALPTDSIRPGTIRNGDLLLWGSSTLVVFYLTFDSPYSYTRIGRVDDPALD
jgi:hypothetical protein